MSIELPPLTQEPILHVDGTPDWDYPLRILRAYRANCDCRWASTTDGSEEDLSFALKYMNEIAEKRARLLDAAIATLEGRPVDSQSTPQKEGESE